MADSYIGSELELFKEAKGWKSYWASIVAREIHGRVLEVGAGIGSNTETLLPLSNAREWTALEPDPKLCEQIRVTGARTPHRVLPRVHQGTLSTLAEGGFDTLLYLDVLEHIEDDAAEVERAARALSPGGALIVLAPAHRWLFSEFDRSIGHFRRYNHDSLSALIPTSLFQEKSFRYLDSVGIAASAMNRLLLHQNLPTRREIRIWDRVMIPVSRVLDPLLGYHLGKSLLGVWIRRD